MTSDQKALREAIAAIGKKPLLVNPHIKVLIDLAIAHLAQMEQEDAAEPDAIKLKTITVTYPAGHTSTSTWDRTSYYCMNCGHRAVWAEQVGDYYQGEEHRCDKCGYSWNMPGEPRPASGEIETQRWQALRIPDHIVAQEKD